jgi:hypothetical protein
MEWPSYSFNDGRIEPSRCYGDGKWNAYTVGIRANPDVEEAYERKRAQHLANVTNEVWVVISTTYPRAGWRLWTWRRSVLEICPMSTPTTLVFTAIPILTPEGDVNYA